MLAIDQGPDIYHRSCPIVSGKVRECIHCPICHTMCGFGGAGAFSDGKFNFTTAFGGWLTDFMDPGTVMNLIEYVDSINVAHGATEEVYSTETAEAKALARRALGYDLHLLQARCKHLGTEKNLMILQNIYEDLKEKLEFRFNTSATNIEKADGGYGRGYTHALTQKRRRAVLQLSACRTGQKRRGVVLRCLQKSGTASS